MSNPWPKLSAEERIEIHRAMREAAPDASRNRVARELAKRYGVSVRTVYRYAIRPGSGDAARTLLRRRIWRWAAERGHQLSYDDVETLIVSVVLQATAS